MKQNGPDKKIIKDGINIYVGEEVPANQISWEKTRGVTSVTDTAIVLGPCAKRTKGDVCSAHVSFPYFITQNGRCRLHPDDAEPGNLPLKECKWRCDGSEICELERGRPRKRRYFTKFK